MRKVIDAVAGGEIWVEIAAGLTVWHVDELGEDGGVVRSMATSDAKKAKAAWTKLKARRPAWVAEKGAAGWPKTVCKKF